MNTFFISDEVFSKNAIAICTAGSFTPLRENRFTIAPWIEPNFWNNIRNKQFAEVFLLELMGLIDREVHPPRRPSNASKLNVAKKLSKQSKSALRTLLHISISYHRSYLPKMWKQIADNLTEAGYPLIDEVFLELTPRLEKSSDDIEDIVRPMIKQYPHLFLTESIPLYCFLNIIRFIRNNRDALDQCFDKIARILKDSLSHQQVIVLLHLILFILGTFPGVKPDSLASIQDVLISKLAVGNPISDIACEIGQSIEKEMKYPGYTYFLNLRYVVEMSPLNNGIIPLLFDQTQGHLPSLMLNRFPAINSLHKALKEFIEFYVHAKYHCNDEIPSQDLIEICQALEFNRKCTNKLLEKYKFKENCPPITYHDHPILPPLIPISIIRVPIHFSYIAKMTTEYERGYYIFNNPSNRTFIANVIQPILDYLSKNPECDFIEQKVILCGNDNFISSLILSVFHAYLQNPQISHVASLTYYLLPISKTQEEGSIASFLAANDPIYERYVYHLYKTASELLPKLADQSDASFPTIEEPLTNEFHEDVYFSDPSPSKMMQFGLNHFLLYARSYVDVYVWKCVIEMENETIMIIVPFISSLHFGNHFTNKQTGPFPEDTPKIYTVNMKTIDVDNNEEVSSKKISSLAIWNANAELHVRPNDGWLFLETISKPTMTVRKATRLSQSMIRGFEFSLVKNESFKIMIDQRVYEPIKKLTISKMENKDNHAEQMSLRFATFTPIQ